MQPCYSLLSFAKPDPIGTYLSLSLRDPQGLKERQRRGNLQTLDLKRKDCFASLAMTMVLGLSKRHSGLTLFPDERPPGIFSRALDFLLLTANHDKQLPWGLPL
jgi:hypothetical protein